MNESYKSNISLSPINSIVMNALVNTENRKFSSFPENLIQKLFCPKHGIGQGVAFHEI